MVKLLWKTAWCFLRILKIELLHDPAVQLLCIYPKLLKAGLQTDIYTHMFMAELLTVAEMWKQPKCPLLDKWIRKM